MVADYSKQFYASRAWRELREFLIVERGGKCERTGKTYTDTSKLIGHHKIVLTPDNINDASISLNPDNIEIIDINIHNQEHKRFGHAKGVYIVWGSPLSGKSTYINQVATYGDLIVDIDNIWQAISGQPRYTKPNQLKANVFGIRDLLYDQVRVRQGQWGDAYIIGGLPNKIERDRLEQRLGAETVYIDSTRQECMDRLGDRPSEWVQYINDWWEEFERNG